VIRFALLIPAVLVGALLGHIATRAISIAAHVAVCASAPEPTTTCSTRFPGDFIGD
jgi:hypothetical protein